jgi:hypothetical protein
VWETIGLSFYDPTGGHKLGAGGARDGDWQAVWREVLRRGVNQGGFLTQVGTTGTSMEERWSRGWT